jgi:hypothetical protein
MRFRLFYCLERRGKEKKVWLMWMALAGVHENSWVIELVCVADVGM